MLGSILHNGASMTIVRSRKARILEKAGLRYVAGWLPVAQAQLVLEKYLVAQAVIDEALKNVDD